MNMLVLDHEAALRLGCFLGIFLLVSCWELAAPRRTPADAKGRRWFTNLSITALNTLAVRLLLPLQAVGTAQVAAERGWGLLAVARVPAWAGVAIAVVLLDFAIYLQHRWFHRVPLFWRLHKVHHTDLDIDVTTGARFHPLEILLSMVIKMLLVLLLGPPAAGVVVFEVLLNGTSMFNHGNVRMPGGLDRVLRLLVVTPDMHRVHHSILPRETNSNFGFNLPWWDRLLGTYRPQPENGHVRMAIGLPAFRDPSRLTLRGILALPFSPGR
jgi:sterol desaturase/sphingolipid hydroxylase (fatty acid hydroxylase superfamily)